MEIIAHRGFWKETAEMNTKVAFRRAVEHGFGIETDIRDFGSEIVISHDPSQVGAMPLRELIEDFSKPELTLALNIKSDGLSPMLSKILRDNVKLKNFVFDMSGPEYFKYKSIGIRTFDRRSEFEPGFDSLTEPDGVWLDAFKSDDWMLNWLQSRKGAKFETVIVSPELHGRPHLDFWAALKECVPTHNLSICTDFPIDAEKFFGVHR
jgi:hypothetical protein